jgi:hypothetical protein
MSSPMGSFLLSPEGNRVELIRLGDLQIPSYQRGTMRSSVFVSKDFDPDLFEVITVSRRPNGSLWIIDGLQRVTGLRTKHGEAAAGMLILARIIEGATIEREVYLFIELNKRRVRVSAYAIFHAELEAGEKSALALDNAIRSVRMWTGLDEYDTGSVTAGERNSAGKVGCIDWLKKHPMTWSDGPVIIQMAIEIAKRAYGSQQNVLHTAIVGGLCLVLREIFNGEAATQWSDTRDFAERIRKFSDTNYPDLVLSKCRNGRNLGGGHGLPQVAAGYFAAAWNYGRRNPNYTIRGDIKITGNVKVTAE